MLTEEKAEKLRKECIMDGVRKMGLRSEDARNCGVWSSSILGNCPTHAYAETGR